MLSSLGLGWQPIGCEAQHDLVSARARSWLLSAVAAAALAATGGGSAASARPGPPRPQLRGPSNGLTKQLTVQWGQILLLVGHRGVRPSV